MDQHEYAARIVWEGNRGDGTTAYAAYGRRHRIVVDGCATIAGSADPAFRGDGDAHNPEQLLVAAVAACHMLTYLALCARAGLRVVGYEDDATGTLRLDRSGGGRFERIELHPVVTVDGDVDRAEALHDEAHARCFIAQSCAFPIGHRATVRAMMRGGVS
jgi:organic hydroperoxide reductase OsmC/OhrA